MTYVNGGRRERGTGNGEPGTGNRSPDTGRRRESGFEIRPQPSGDWVTERLSDELSAPVVIPSAAEESRRGRGRAPVFPYLRHLRHLRIDAVSRIPQLTVAGRTVQYIR